MSEPTPTDELTAVELLHAATGWINTHWDDNQTPNRQYAIGIAKMLMGSIQRIDSLERTLAAQRAALLYCYGQLQPLVSFRKWLAQFGQEKPAEDPRERYEIPAFLRKKKPDAEAPG